MMNDATCHMFCSLRTDCPLCGVSVPPYTAHRCGMVWVPQQKQATKKAKPRQPPTDEANTALK